MKYIVLYFMVLYRFQITLSQELSSQTIDYATQENEESSTTSVTNIDDINSTEGNKPLHESLSGSNPKNDEGLDYPFKTLMRILKVKGSITDSFDGASKIFGGLQDVGGELFGMIKDGALNIKNYLSFK